MKRSTSQRAVRRIVSVLLIVLFSFCTLSVVGSVVAFRVIYRRTDNLNSVVKLRYSGIDSRRYPRQEVSFLSGENRLHGFLYGAGSKGVIVIAPGVSSDSEAHLPEIMRFLDSGYTALAYDMTGVCRSEGESRVGLQQAKSDLLAAVGFVRQKNLPIYLYGHSLGAYAVAAALDETEVTAAVCLSGFDSPVGMMHDSAKAHVGILADVEYPFLVFQNVLTFGGDADDRAVESINAVDTPVLLCHGAGDDVIPYEQGLNAQADRLTNPNAVCETVDAAFRSGHSYMWLSADAARYMAQKQEELDDLTNACGGEVPQRVLEDFYRDFDAKKAAQTDGSFMDGVLRFYQEASS